MKNWYPKKLDLQVKLTNRSDCNEGSAWGQIAYAIKDLISDFNVKTERAVEFGCEFGYSTSVLANYFDDVVAYDLFTGDKHAGFRDNFKEITSEALRDFKNITLIQMNCLDAEIAWGQYDFAHIDIVHDYEPTYKAGDMLLKRDVPVVVFHDTLSFPDVHKAVCDLGQKHDCDVFNYPYSHGLGILVKR